MSKYTGHWSRVAGVNGATLLPSCVWW